MKYTQGYGSLIINFDGRNKMYLTPAKGSNIAKEVLPDATEFVTLYCKDTVILTGLDVADLYIYPGQSKESLIKEYRNRLSMAQKSSSIVDPLFGF